MLFFQVVLLAGYAYAHLHHQPALAALAERCCICALLARVAGVPADRARARSGSRRAKSCRSGGSWSLLAGTIGLPYFLLSSTGPLLQESFRRETGRTPYRLYSLSNIGSLLALLTYPFVFEPQLTLQTQIVAWSMRLCVCSCCCAAGVPGGSRGAAMRRPALPKRRWLQTRPSGRRGADRAVAGAGGLRLGDAAGDDQSVVPGNHSVPFLWVVPLALYLLTFIICFDHERWYHRGMFLRAAGRGRVLAVLLRSLNRRRMSIWQQLGDLFGHAVGLLHGLPRRAGACQAGAAICHVVLPDGRGRRRRGRHPGGDRRAAGAARFLGISDRAGRHRGCLAAFRRCQRSAQPGAGGAAHAVAGRRGQRVIGVGIRAGRRPRHARTDTSGRGRRNLETTRNFYGVLRVNEAATDVDDDPTGPTAS